VNGGAGEVLNIDCVHLKTDVLYLCNVVPFLQWNNHPELHCVKRFQLFDCGKGTACKPTHLDLEDVRYWHIGVFSPLPKMFCDIPGKCTKMFNGLLLEDGKKPEIPNNNRVFLSFERVPVEMGRG